MDIYKGQAFPHRKAATAHMQDAAFIIGKKVLLSKKVRSAHNWEYICSSTTPCPFFVRMLAAQRANAGGCFVSKLNLQHVNCTSFAVVNARQAKAMSSIKAVVAADAQVPAKALIHQVQATHGCIIPLRTAYRVRDAVAEDLFGSFDDGIRKLEGLVEQFRDLNGGDFGGIERDDEGRFRRLFVVHPFSARYVVGAQHVMGIDAAHLKHPRYNGVVMVLVGRDGNNQNIELAFAVCHSEDTCNYEWFFNACATGGVLFADRPLFSDRNGGLIAAARNRADISLRFCMRHIMDNIRDKFKASITKDVEEVIWRAQRADSSDEFKGILAALTITHPLVVAYIQGIDAIQWALHPVAYTTKLYGWATTSFVEAENSASLLTRRLPLYQFVENKMSKLMMKAVERTNQIDQWVAAGRVLTPYAQELYEEQLKLIGYYGIQQSTYTKAFVWDSRKTVVFKRRVDLNIQSCTCVTRSQYGIPCRHILAVLSNSRRMSEAFDFFDPCYLIAHASSYLTLPIGAGGDQQGIEVPTGEGVEPTDLKPPVWERRRGRPQINRYASRGETTPKKVYRCRQCKATDHNVRRCTHANPCRRFGSAV